MKKQITALFLTTTMVLTCTAFGGCSDTPDEECVNGETSRMTVDINPSVEFIVDEENKVISATALNDDGSVILAGETVVGKNSEEAVELVVSLSCEAGYLVKGNVTADENTVAISVSGNTEYAKTLRENAVRKAQTVMDQSGVMGRAEQAEALKIQKLRELAASCTSCSDEEINEMTETELCKAIAAGRIETAELSTMELKEAYYAAKEYEISFAEREETAKIIQAMGGAYTLVYNGYKTVLDAYGTAIGSLDELRYDLLVSPDSEYQKSLSALREAKSDLLKQKNLVASLEVTGTEYASAKITLQLSEKKYDETLALYEKLGDDANAALKSAVSTLRGYEAQLAALEENFSEDVEAELAEKAKETENAVNAKKDSFFEKFESEHKEDIEKAEAELIARKQKLIDSFN